MKISHRENTMRNQFLKKQLRIAAACAVALGTLGTIAGNVGAQTTTPNNLPPNDRALVVNSTGQVWMSGFGECWHNAFGPAPAAGSPCGPRPVAQAVPAPQPVAQYVAPAPKPAPAPVPVAQPVKVVPVPVYEKATFNVNVLFDFDKAVLRPAGRETLDGFMTSIKGIGSAEIKAVGYADRFGSNEYNQKLSERRVSTVRNYLTGKGIDGKWIDTSAKGEEQPTTKAGACDGAASASTIACLQPDRHVSVEFSGSRLKQ